MLNIVSISMMYQNDMCDFGQINASRSDKSNTVKGLKHCQAMIEVSDLDY
jgi:hypothetical protein